MYTVHMPKQPKLNKSAQYLAATNKLKINLAPKTCHIIKLQDIMSEKA